MTKGRHLRLLQCIEHITNFIFYIPNIILGTIKISTCPEEFIIEDILKMGITRPILSVCAIFINKRHPWLAIGNSSDLLKMHRKQFYK
jgi:hypothetical protein